MYTLAQYATIKGYKIRYSRSGKGPPLILLHTLRTQLDYFYKVVPILSNSFDVYALDLLGHGYSDKPNVHYDEPTLQQYVYEFLLAEQLNQVTIVGESIGGALALTLAAEHPNLITKVFSLNPYDYPAPNGNGIRRSSLLANIVFGAMPLPLLGPIFASTNAKALLRYIMYGGVYREEHLEESLLTELYNAGKLQGYARAFRSVIAESKSWVMARRLYDKIKVPVSLVYGDHDWSYPEERVSNHKLIPNSRYTTLENTGHFSCLDSPEAVTKTILEN
jgi:pimeloyl-ACP methyl ester carboxylesterase